MKRYLTVTVQRSANHKAEEHRLKPAEALEKYQELKATQKRVWPKVEIAEYVGKDGEPGEVSVFEAEGLLTVVTPERVYVRREDEGVKTFREKKAKKKGKKKSRK